MAIEVVDIMRAANARLPVGGPSTTVRGAFVDSRAPIEGALFVGMRGEVTDGGQYAWDALRGGAAAAIITESAWRWIEGDVLPLKKPVIVASDPLAALQAASGIALQRSGARVVGITGAVGKTTTKDILVALLREAGVHVHGSAGNRNTEVGVPLTLMEIPDGTDVVVVEMAMRGSGQIAELARLAPPHVACITSVGAVHLELLGSVEAVARAKAEILVGLGPGDVAVVPDVEPLLEEYIARLDPGVRVERFGDAPDADVSFDLPMAWMRRNAAAAVACARALGQLPEPGRRVAVTLSALRGAERPLGDGRLIEDCYNANPVSMRAALADLGMRDGRRVAVLADMRELGADAERLHHEVGEEVARMGVDLLVAVGDFADAYVAGAAGVPSVRFVTVEECILGLAAHLEPGDTVLLKGSRGMALERVGAALLNGTP